MDNQLRRGTCVEKVWHECWVLYKSNHRWLFLIFAAVIGWILKQLDTQRGSVKLLCKIGDCSYEIFCVHMAVLTVIGKFIQSCDWYLYWSLRFAMTLIISFTIIFFGQKILKNQTKLLRFIGFI